MKLLIIDTMQHFEIEVEDDVDEKDFVESDECRTECAERIKNGTTDLILDQVSDSKDENGNWETF